MALCTENKRTRRKRRLKNRSAWLCKKAAKMTPKRGAKPYYEVHDLKIKRVGKKRVKLTWRERTTPAYDAVFRKLMEMCKGMTVQLSPELFKPKLDTPANPALN